MILPSSPTAANRDVLRKRASVGISPPPPQLAGSQRGRNIAQLQSGADVGAGVGAQHVQVQIAVVDQTLTVPLPGGSAPQRGLLDVGIHGHREKQLTLGEADHRLVTTHQLHGIDSGGHSRDVRGHDCDPDTSPAMSGEKRIGPGLASRPGRRTRPGPHARPRP